MFVGGLQDNSTFKVNSANSSAIWEDIGSGDGAYSAIGNNGKVIVISWQMGGMWIWNPDTHVGRIPIYLSLIHI